MCYIENEQKFTFDIKDGDEPPPIWNVIKAARTLIAEPKAINNVTVALRNAIDRDSLTMEDINRIDFIVAHWAGCDTQFSYVGNDVVFRPNTNAKAAFWWAATVAAMLEHGGVSGGQPVNFPLYVSIVVATAEDVRRDIANRPEELRNVSRFTAMLRLAIDSILAGCPPDCQPEHSDPDLVDAHFAAGMPRVFAPPGLSDDDANLAEMMIKNVMEDYPFPFDWPVLPPGVRFPDPIGSRLLMAYRLVEWLVPPDIAYAFRVNGLSPIDALTVAGMACQMEGREPDEYEAWRDLIIEMLKLTSKPAFQIMVLPAVII